MSMPFSDTTNNLGLIQDCEMKLFGDDGYGRISANATRLKQFTARINRRQDMLIQLALTSDGVWQYDDTNNTDYPEFTTDIVSGQRDYPLDVSMIEIDKVCVKNAATNGIFSVIPPMDIQDQNATTYIANNPTNVGIPWRYDKTANSIILDPTPNYSCSGGLKVIAHRGANYFVSTDTTKVPGFAGHLHEYLSAGAAFDYATDRGMDRKAAKLAARVAKLESDIVDFFSKRSRDQQKQIKPAYRSSR